MALDMVSLLTSMENLLEKNNTTTSSNDVSASLNKRVQGFYKGVRGFSDNIPIPRTLLPAVCVELDAKTEELPFMGGNAVRDMDVTFDIVPITGYGAGVSEGLENSDLELIRLTQNIEGLIRTKITLSSTVESLEITSTDFSVVVKSPDTYVSVARISLLAKLRSRS